MWHRTEHQMTFVLIRHGETQANAEHRYLGRTDEALSMAGREALRIRLERGDYPAADLLFVSPMRRCLETARLLYPQLQPVVIPQWRETDFGRFEYRNYAQLRHDPDYRAWIDSGGSLPFPEGESREAVQARCEAGFCDMCRQLQQTSSELLTVAAVVHGGTIMTLLARYGGGDYYAYQTPNGGGFLCRLELGETARLTDVYPIGEDAGATS